MTHVVTDACVGCKYTDCVAVCPVDCFHEGPNFIVIDPEVCIDCGVCIPECPVEAIVDEKDLPAGQVEYLEPVGRARAGDGPEGLHRRHETFPGYVVDPLHA